MQAALSRHKPTRICRLNKVKQVGWCSFNVSWHVEFSLNATFLGRLQSLAMIELWQLTCWLLPVPWMSWAFFYMRKFSSTWGRFHSERDSHYREWLDESYGFSESGNPNRKCCFVWTLQIHQTGERDCAWLIWYQRQGWPTFTEGNVSINVVCLVGGKPTIVHK